MERNHERLEAPSPAETKPKETTPPSEETLRKLGSAAIDGANDR